jgi:acyl-CoA thioesterase
VSLFDHDSALRRVDEARFEGAISDRWNVGPVPNGGYVLTLAARAIGETFPGREPRSMTAHYLRPAKVGPVEIAVETLKVGRRHANAVAKILQRDREGALAEHARVIATFGTADAGSGPTAITATPPALPPVEESFVAPVPDFVEIGKRFEFRFAPETGGFLRGEPSGTAEIRAWVRFADGREPDLWSLPLIADALPPPLLNIASFRWVPTLELTVHVRARPAPGWLRCVFRSRFVFGGYLESDGEIWDSEGVPVAISRQLATTGE